MSWIARAGSRSTEASISSCESLKSSGDQSSNLTDNSPHRVIPPRIDVRENPFDRGADALIALGGGLGIDTGFDYLDHCAGPRKTG